VNEEALAESGAFAPKRKTNKEGDKYSIKKYKFYLL
jgi:hypothetical protein